MRSLISEDFARKEHIRTGYRVQLTTYPSPGLDCREKRNQIKKFD